MAKAKTIYVCQNCGASSPRWQGRCPTCGEWNTLAEERTGGSGKGRGAGKAVRLPDGPEPRPLSDISTDARPRVDTGSAEFDRVLGGGFVPGSSVLVGGDPGVGKSTLLLQTAGSLAGRARGVLYISAEEAPEQIRLRSQRIRMGGEEMLVHGEADAEIGVAWADKLRPGLVVVDSIQTCRRSDFDAAPGTVTQVREVVSLWADWAKRSSSCVALVGHVTKEGAIAGPKTVEHLVDAVLLFEGDHVGGVRVLRSLKNRFGATGELGVFEMGVNGLEGVADPSRLFLSERDADTSGVAVASVVRGSRPLLIELQALVSRTYFSQPQRNATGVDPRRLALWCAVLEKRVGLGLVGQDIFLNATGGVRLDDSAADLAACVAIASSLRDLPIDRGTVFVGEVGLTGEVRAVPGLERRLAEAAHLKFRRAIVPRSGYKGSAPKGLEVLPVRTLEEAVTETITG